MSTGAKTAQAWNQWEGQIVDGKFPLLAYLGGTERSAVFLTERPEGEPRRAAIKLVPADDAAAEALLARWNASAPLSHPDLMRLFETGRGSLGGIAFAYVLTEYADENLQDVDRPLTAEEAADMLEGVLKALSYLHDRNLAHGHLKPSNILAVAEQLKISIDTVRPEGKWRADLEAPGPYDPPEIAQDGASGAGDMWSLGVTLVEALTKRPPAWDGDQLAASVLDSLPARFRVPVSNCLRPDARERCTATELAKSLRQKEEVPVRPAGESFRASSARSRYLLPAGVAGLTLAAIMIVPRLTSDRAAPALPESGPADLKRGPLTQPESQKVPSDIPAAKSPGRSPDRGILAQVLPDVPAKARNTIRGKVAVNIRVKVDANGSVVNAQNESPGSSRYFVNLGLQAARRWRFAPVDADSAAHPADWTLRFQFVRDPNHPVSVKAAPAR